MIMIMCMTFAHPQVREMDPTHDLPYVYGKHAHDRCWTAAVPCSPCTQQNALAMSQCGPYSTST